MKEVERRVDGVVVSLNEDELEIVIAGLRETLQELEDWEFETRTGFQRAEMRRLLDEVLRVATRTE